MVLFIRGASTLDVYVFSDDYHARKLYSDIAQGHDIYCKHPILEYLSMVVRFGLAERRLFTRRGGVEI